MEEIRKRDGRIVPFNPEKITIAIQKAILAVGEQDGKLAKNIADQVVQRIEDHFKTGIPGVEDVQDVVEEVLILNGHAKVAKAYILYRQKKSESRDAKKLLGVEKDELKLSLNAIRVLERRYLLKDENGRIAETPAAMFRRVAKTVAEIDEDYGGDVKQTEKEFFEMMAKLEFLPNSPTIMNAGTKMGQLSACFVLPVEDSLKEIFGTLTNMSIIHQSGGGTGFSFSRLRPKGDMVQSTKGVASGPLSFMTIFDQATEVVKQGGRRRGANMGILRIDHPDIIEFITSKEKEGFLRNFNISVAVTDKFMKAVEEDQDYELINPRTGKVTRKLRARDVFDLIITMVWQTGDPGMVFLDEINRRQPLPQNGNIESTNPCGEIPLFPYESCNLGSINLSAMVDEGGIDWDKLRETVRKGIHFLDNVIDANNYPLEEIKTITKQNRKVGLGVMGFAELLARLSIPYNSEEALGIAERIMEFIKVESLKKSVEMGVERGSFPNFEMSTHSATFKAMRHATLNTVAPTGTLSIIAGTSPSIEPIFAISFVRNVMGTQLLEVNPVFEDLARKRGFYSKDLMIKISRSGSIRDIPEIPEDIKDLFVTALDIAPEWHVKMQAAFQKHVDNAVAKTVNLPEDATLDDVRKIYMLAYKLKCKGITSYRYGSKNEQVLVLGGLTGGKEKSVVAESEFSGECLRRECGG